MKIITTGLSRLVIIHKDNAIKIPWLNILAIVKSYRRNKREGKLGEKINRFGGNKVLVIYNYILYVLNSNRREYLYYTKNKDKEYLLPIKKTFLFGHILIQPKGNVLREQNQNWKKIVKKIKRACIDHIDLLKPDNFCVSNGRIKLLDYANKETQKIIEDMEAGVSPENAKKTLSILDRKQPIKTAAALSKTGDIILIAGKGHETYQEINGIRHDFNDFIIAQEILNN